MGILILLGLILFAAYILHLKNRKTDSKIGLNPENKKSDLTDTIQFGIDKVKKFTEKKITEQYLLSGNWQLDSEEKNIIFTFRNNGELLITENGIVKKVKFEFIINNNSLIITENDISKMYVIENLKNDLLLMKSLSDNNILCFYNQTKLKDKIIREIKREEKIQEELEQKRKTDPSFKFKEIINSPIYETIENEAYFTSKVANYPGGIFSFINDKKNENKEVSEIIADFEKWKNGNSHLTLFNYAYFIENQNS